MPYGGENPFPQRAVIRTLLAAAMLVFLFSIVSLDSDRQQERFNAGAIATVAGAALAYLLAVGWFAGRPRSRGASLWPQRFIRWGGIALIAAALAAYVLSASIFAGRVL